MIAHNKTTNKEFSDPKIYETMGHEWIVIDIYNTTHRFSTKHEADEYFNVGQYKKS